MESLVAFLTGEHVRKAFEGVAKIVACYEQQTEDRNAETADYLIYSGS